jgi:hypothetical protein
MDRPRALTLSIQANNAEQLRKLLELALYELDCAIGESSKTWAAREGEVVAGEVTGTMGRYRFDYMLGSPAFVECRKKLLEEGYQEEATFGLDDYDLYRHPETGHGLRLYFNPAEVRDHEESPSPKPLF